MVNAVVRPVCIPACGFFRSIAAPVVFGLWLLALSIGAPQAAPAEESSTLLHQVIDQQVSALVQSRLPQSAWAMDLHPDGLHLLMAHHDRQLRLYDMSPEPAVPDKALPPVAPRTSSAASP